MEELKKYNKIIQNMHSFVSAPHKYLNTTGTVRQIFQIPPIVEFISWGLKIAKWSTSDGNPQYKTNYSFSEF